MGEGKIDRGRWEKTGPLDGERTQKKRRRREEDIGLIREESEWEKRASAERRMERERERERIGRQEWGVWGGDVILSVFPRGDSDAC